MKKLPLISGVLCALTMTQSNAQCANYDCSTADHQFEFSGTLETIGGYSNTNGDVCYIAENGTISTGTNWNNWNNLSFTSTEGNFQINQNLNVQSNDNVYFNTNLSLSLCSLPNYGA